MPALAVHLSRWKKGTLNQKWHGEDIVCALMKIKDAQFMCWVGLAIQKNANQNLFQIEGGDNYLYCI
jgi:hypothetical protein